MQKKSADNSVYETLGDRWYTAFDDPVALLRSESRVKVPWVQEKVDLHFGKGTQVKCLDVGCGAGFLSNALASDRYQVTGIDLSQDSLRVAKKYDATKSVEYLEANAYELPFADKSFDVITAMDFLEHVDDPARVISEISRVLKPSGLFFFHTFNRNWLSHLVIIKAVEFFVKNTPKDMHVINLFITPEELKSMCQKSKMEVAEMTGIRPQFSTLKFKSLWSGVVPENFSFQLTKSLKLSYMGYAQKNG